MLRKTIYITALLMFVSLQGGLLGCSKSDASTGTESTAQAEKQNPEDAKISKEKQREEQLDRQREQRERQQEKDKKDPKDVPKVASEAVFGALFFTWEPIFEGETPKYCFDVYNTGTEPLEIIDVKKG